MFNHWFALVVIPGSIIKGVITLPKKGGREKLDDYKPITQLNTWAWVLANRLQLIVSDLVGAEQNYPVKGRSIQDKLHLVRRILEGIENDTEAALINLDHRFLSVVSETARFAPEFCKWIRQWCRWTEGARSPLQLSGRSGRVVPWILFTIVPWNPCSLGLEMRRKIRPWSEFPLSVVSGQGSPLSSMI